MISEKHSAAARANGALSQGPKTLEGKARSGQKPRECRLSDIIVLPNENPDAFDELLDDFVRRFGPVDQVELAFIEEMVVANWRKYRAFAIEKELILCGTANLPPGDELNRMAAASTDPDGVSRLHPLQIQQARLQRIYSHALRDLALLRRHFPKNLHQSNEPNSPCISNKNTGPNPLGQPDNSPVPNPAPETQPTEPNP